MMTATTAEVTEPTSAFRLGWLPVLLLAALILRLWWLQSFTAVIENEGTEYARIAENLLKGDGYVGKRNEGPQLMFPPLYPFLIAAFSFLVAELDLAGRTVSVLFGTLLVAVIFFIAERIHGRRIAWIAAGLAAFHPWMIGMSAAVYSESTYLTLVMAGVYWALCSLETPSLRRAALSGACFERKGVDVVVLKETVTNRPYLREWMAKGIPDTRAERLLDFHDPVAGRVVIYRWNHGPHRR